MRNQVKWYFISYKLIIKGLIQCSELEACKSGLFEPNIDFMSLTAENSFYCDRYYLKEWGIFTVLFSGCIISFIFVLLEDVFGKKRILLTSFFLFFFSGIFIFLIKSVYFKFAGFALLWAINQIFDITLLMLVNELTVGKKRLFANVFLTSMIYISGLFGNLLTVYLKSYKNLYLLIFAGYLISYILLALLIPNSPLLMFNLRKFDEYRNSINYICDVNNLASNKKEKINFMIDNLIESKYTFCTKIIDQKHSEIQPNKTKQFFISFYKKNKNICLALNFCFLFLLIFLEFYLFQFSIEKFPSFRPVNVYTALLIAHLLGFVLNLFLLGKSPRKTLTFICSFGILFCSSVMLISSFIFSNNTVEYFGLFFSGKLGTFILNEIWLLIILNIV